jgi:phage terminase large subunit
MCPGSTHSVFRWRLSDLVRSVVFGTLEEVRRLCFKDIQTKFKYDRQRNVLFIGNGSKIWFAGLEDNKGSQKVLGTGVSTIFFNEASEIPYHAYTICRTRLSEKNSLQPKFFIDENPPANKMHWTYKMFFEFVNPLDYNMKLDRDRNVSLQMNPKDNLENIPQDYIEELKNLPARERTRFLEGKFGDGVEGGVYTDVIEDAEKDGRVEQDLLRDINFPTQAVFDVGWRDATAVWVVQFLPNEIRFLDYLEKTRTEFSFFMREIWNRGYQPNMVYLPHDTKFSLARAVENGMNYEMLARRFGSDPNLEEEKKFTVNVLDKPGKVFDGINTARMMFRKCRFDKDKCMEGIHILKNYRFVYNDKLGVFSDEPFDDWTSHGADAFRYVFMSFFQQQPKKFIKKKDMTKLYYKDIVGDIFHNTRESVEY